MAAPYSLPSFSSSATALRYQVAAATKSLSDVGLFEPLSCFAAVEDGVEGLAAPFFEGIEDVFGGDCVGVVWVVEEAFEIPAELAHEAELGAAFYGEFVGGEDVDWREGFVVGAGEDEGWRV